MRRRVHRTLTQVRGDTARLGKNIDMSIAPSSTGPTLGALSPGGGRANHLLSRLDPACHSRGTTLSLSAGDVFSTHQHVWFPVDCVVALNLSDGDQAVDALVVGREGLIGPGDIGPGRWIVRLAGSAVKVDRHALHMMRAGNRAFDAAVAAIPRQRAGALQHAVLCSHTHKQEARLATLLLRLADAAGRSEIRVNQQELAVMLGAQRTTINAAAKDLKDRRIIRYLRGRIAILDRDALEIAACGCRRASYEPPVFGG